MNHKLLYLSKYEVAKVGVTMADTIDIIERAFIEMGNNNVEMPPKPAIHPGDNGDNFIHAMPAYIPAMRSAGIKWISGYPDNQKKGLPYIMGLLILNDTETGLPLAVMDCSWITAMRTGAASAVSAKYLARKESSKIGIIACGVQGHTNLEAMSVLFPLKKVMAFDPNREQSKKLASYASTKLGIEVEIVDEPKKAVTGCDIVVTSGPILKQPHETIKAGWVDEGTFISCVDFDSFFSREAFNQASKWTTDNIAQYNHYKENLGYFQNCPDIYAELGELVTGRKVGRENNKEINFAANLGLAMEDMALAPLVYKKASEKGIGVWLEL
ncbi:MAG: ornithine cyclodeaminase family protein [Desulfamplus sp.]|nr:ornithine cyclodeaminase family protein [Desulfamplus sp.]